MKEVNRVTVIDTPWWYKIWQRNGFKHIGAKKMFTGDPEEPNEVPVADEETKSHLHRQFFGILQILRGTILESLYVNAAQIRNEWDCRKSSAQSERRDICGAVAVWSGQRMVGVFHGVFLLFAKTDKIFRLMERKWSNMRKTYRDHINFVQKSYQENSSVMYCIRRDLERRHHGRRHSRIEGNGRIRTPRKKAQCKKKC